MYREEDFLQLSGIQHFVFCRRQWALSYIEMQWQENVRTAEGRILHEKAHDPSLKEKRGDLLIVRAMPVHSREMGVSGECDVVEFHKAPEGISLAGREAAARTVIRLSDRSSAIHTIHVLPLILSGLFSLFSASPAGYPRYRSDPVYIPHSRSRLHQDRV